MIDNERFINDLEKWYTKPIFTLIKNRNIMTNDILFLCGRLRLLRKRLNLKPCYGTKDERSEVAELKGQIYRITEWVAELRRRDQTAEGEAKGEYCYRDGCTGILDEYEKRGGCTCFQGHAPCGNCTYDPLYCPECGFEPEQP